MGHFFHEHAHALCILAQQRQEDRGLPDRLTTVTLAAMNSVSAIPTNFTKSRLSGMQVKLSLE
jgi:hypothetical protein